MEIVLHRFPLSHFCEKGRLLLELKRLPYRIRDTQLGLPQLRILRLSGQRKLPVIEDDGQVVADSTEIALHLERRHRERPLLPDEPAERRSVLALEDRIDRVMGGDAPLVWFDWIARERPDDVRRFIQIEVWGAGRGAVLGGLARRAWRLPMPRERARRAAEKTRVLLEELCQRLDKSRYLCGDEPSLADVAAAGLAFHLELPKTDALVVPELAGTGVPGWADAPELRTFFEWRRRFYAEHDTRALKGA
jgi:glutathione S-transferase